MKRIISIIAFASCCILITSTEMYAQTAPADTTALVKPMFPEILSNGSFYLISGLFLIMLIVIFVLSRAVTHLGRNILGYHEPEKIEVSEEEGKEKESLWKWFDRNVLTKAVPIEKEKDIMFDHSYDGIYELDNDLPPWWKYGFYLTIFFAFAYLINYHVLKTGKLQLAEYKDELAAADLQAKERMANNANFITSENVVALSDAGEINAGKEIFQKNCVACHGANGEGLVGPNFTDNYWIHGGGIKNVFKTITNGVPAKGMISWKSQLSPKQIQEVGSYVLTLQGTKVTNGKEPQGDIWIDTSAPTDTSAITIKDSSVIVIQASSSGKK